MFFERSRSHLFQSTLPRRERPEPTHKVRFIHVNFNPRSRGGSDLSMFPRYFSITISIHAPAEGATMATAALWKRRKFQSTLPRRERHAFRHSIIYYIQYFNPRSRGGSDLNDFLVALFSGVFQSTLPRRERLELAL